MTIEMNGRFDLRNGRKQPVSIAARAVALAIVAVFGFHLSRFYLSIELCTHNVEDGNAMQHCKDVTGWLTAPRVQLKEVPSPAYHAVLAIVPALIEAPAEPVADVSLPPPFHPPRFLS
jgi:hypothetical protein